MNKLLLLFFTLISHFALCQTQTIWFQMQRVNYCTQKTVIDSSVFYLVDKFGVGYKNVDGIVWLRNKGAYTIYYPNEPNTVYPLIQITGDSAIYIHKETKIRFSPRHIVVTFINCEGVLNGVHEDVYDNGRLRMRGNFVNGRPKDSLLLFYENGNPQKSIYYLHKHNYIQEYDSTGNLFKVSRNGNQHLVVNDYETTTFYSNGSIRSIEKRKKGYLLLTEYYPDKTIKTALSKKKRIEYHKNGRPEAIYTWKEKLQGTAYASRTKYEIKKTSFNTEGQRTEEIKYHSFQGNKNQPELLYRPSDLVIYWKKYASTQEETLLYKNVYRNEITETW